MKVLSNAIILEIEERRYQGQYRFPVSKLPFPFPKGSLVHVEVYCIDGGKGVLACFKKADRLFEGVHRVTKNGLITFTPPKGLIPNDAGRKKRPQYKSYKRVEIPFN